MDIEKLSVPELIVLALNNGFFQEIRGMTESELRNVFREKEKSGMVFAVAETQPVAVEGQNVPQPKAESLSWPDLKKLAKAKGINTFKKKRLEIETLLKQKES